MRTPAQARSVRCEGESVKPETKYTRSGDLNIAYQVVGQRLRWRESLRGSFPQRCHSFLLVSAFRILSRRFQASPRAGGQGDPPAGPAASNAVFSMTPDSRGRSAVSREMEPSGTGAKWRTCWIQPVMHSIISENSMPSEGQTHINETTMKVIGHRDSRMSARHTHAQNRPSGTA